MKITEELPCKPLRVRWLCTTTKNHQERTVWNRLCTACEAFSAWALPTARRSPRQREPVVSVAPTNHVGSRASLSFMARGGLPRRLWPGPPFTSSHHSPRSAAAAITHFLIQLSCWSLSPEDPAVSVYCQGLIQQPANRRCSKKSVE